MLIQPKGNAIEASLRGGQVEPVEFAREIASSKNVQIQLFPSVTAVLARTVEVPASAVHRFDSLLKLEIGRWSPYDLSEVYIGWDTVPAEAGVRRLVDLRLVPRTRVDPLIDELAKFDLSPASLVLGPAKGHCLDLRSPLRRRFTNNALVTFVIVTLLLLFVGIDWWRASSDLQMWREEYRKELAALSTQRGLEQRIAKAISAIEESTNSVSKGKLVANLSAVLPETDWLTEVALKGDNLTLRGYSAELERLIKGLETLAEPGSINLQGEVSLDNGVNRQRFSLVLRPKAVQ